MLIRELAGAPVLHRLANEGLLVSTWRKADNRRRRKYYTITEKGLNSLEREKINGSV